MEIKEESFVFFYSHDTRVRHTHKRIKNKVIEFLIQLEIFYKNKWVAVIRYDTAHDFTHCDIIHADGSQDKIPLFSQNYNEALTMAEKELETRWQLERERYIKEAEKNE